MIVTLSPVSMLSCPLCESRPATTREHVWPDWHLKDLDDLGAPKSGWAVNGIPIVDRSSKPVHSSRRQRVLLKICSRCNQTLNQRFEVPAKPVLRRLTGGRWTGPAAEAEWQAVGLWFAKVLLLLGHPLARHEHPAIDRAAIRFEGPGHPDYSWLVDGSEPPQGLSLWVHNCNMDDTTTSDRVPLPREVNTPGGNPTFFEVMTMATRGLCVTMVWHPGWPIIHPLEARGEAWELLRGSPPDGDLSTLPPISAKSIAWMPFSGTLTGGLALDGNLPPLMKSEHWLPPDIMALFDEISF